jgi:ABC-type transport system involved in Fe-S cluster assembly fused permease/ATPase subunit
MLLHFVHDVGLNCTHEQVTREILTDCLLNYETVKYFGGEGYEAQRYTGGYWRVSDFEEECCS